MIREASEIAGKATKKGMSHRFLPALLPVWDQPERRRVLSSLCRVMVAEPVRSSLGNGSESRGGDDGGYKDAHPPTTIPAADY